MLGRQPKGSSKSDLEADFLLNKHVFRTAAYTFAGFGLGLGASLLFFKNKAAMTAVCAGAGAGYGLAGFGSEWSNYQRFKSWMRNQTQQTRQGIDYNQYQSQMSHQKSHQQKDEHKSSQQDQHRDERKTYQSKADNQSQEKSHQQRDEQKSSRQDQHKDEHKDERKAYQSKADNKGQEKSHQQRDEQKSSRQDQHKDEHKTYQSKADNQGQQRQQQQKQQRTTKEEPMNPEAKHKQDIAEEGRTLEREPGRVDTKMGQGRNFYTSTQDKRKREEEAVYSQSMQGDKAGEDEVQRGEKGPQNTQIPPSQRDWTGGHANKGVQQQQVHRGTPESDKMGKSVRPDKEPNTNPDKGVPKQENQALSGVDFSGQKLQTFQSNPLPLGKAGQTHEIQKNYQEGRNRATDPNLDNVKRTIHGIEQDRMGQSIKEGIIHKVRERSPTEAGVGNYRPDVAEQGTKNQVNAVLE